MEAIVSCGLRLPYAAQLLQFELIGNRTSYIIPFVR